MSNNNEFRKRPVVIEAWQVHPNDGKTRPLPPEWLLKPMIAATRNGDQAVGDVCVRDDGNGLDIYTLEGVMHAQTGDWIIRGVKGELYPCKPDIFEATYERAALAAQPVAQAPEGWKLVPVEPTREMRDAFHKANDEANEGTPIGEPEIWSPGHQWSAMLEAAPSPNIEEQSPIQLGGVCRDHAAAEASKPVQADNQCQQCNGAGEVFEHADDCTDDLCALNGDMHSCIGKVSPCGSCSGGKPVQAEAPPQLVQAIMAKLANLLDEDQFKDIEDMVVRAGVTPPAPCGAVERGAIQPWEERIRPAYPLSEVKEWKPGVHLGSVETAMKAEIDELRAALATQPLEQKPVAYRISDPNEPEIGHWYEDAPNGTPYLTSEPLYLGPQPEQVAQDSAVLVRKSVEGVVEFMRQENPNEQVCVCCPPGTGHIYSRRVKLEHFDTRYPKHFRRGPREFVDTIALERNDFEGKRVRITVEVFDDAARASGKGGGE